MSLLPQIRVRRAGTLLAVVTAVLMLAGCQSRHDAAGPEFNGDDPMTTGSIVTRASALANTTRWAKEWQKKPDDARVAVNYAGSLRAIGSDGKALGVLRHATMKNPQNRQVIAEYGKQLADAGQLISAQKMLQKAIKLGRPDWRLYSTQGTILDKMDYHDRARQFYTSALKLAPNEPSILNNLGMSYALSGKLNKAEATLRKANKQPGAGQRVRQNLALVLGLSGRFEEAKRIASADLPPNEVKANMAYLRRMMQQRDMWSAVKKANSKRR